VRDLHEFMLVKSDRVGGGNGYKLAEGARLIPEIREHIESKPATAAKFRVADVGPVEDSVGAKAVTDEMLEFLGSWPHPDRFATSHQRGRGYVNPNYVHAGTLSDLVVECQCGVQMVRNYRRIDKGGNPLAEIDHNDGCKPQWRLEARARMAQRREVMLRRLGVMGWHRGKIAPRFGLEGGTSVAGLPQEYGLSFGGLRDEYHRRAANTYAVAIEAGESAADVAEIYGHHVTTLSRWKREYGGEDPYIEPMEVSPWAAPVPDVVAVQTAERGGSR
jgi:hypothetical protein